MQPNEQSKPKKNTARPLGRLGAVSPCYARAAAYHASRRDLGAGKGPLPDHNGEILPLHARNERDPVDPEHLSLAGGGRRLQEREHRKRRDRNGQYLSSSASPPPRSAGRKRRTTAWSSSPSRAAQPRASCSSCATLRASFSAFRVRNSCEDPRLAAHGACSQVWRRCRNERGRLQRRKRPRQRRRAAGARDLRRSAAPYRARGRAVQRRRL